MVIQTPVFDETDNFQDNGKDGFGVVGIVFNANIHRYRNQWVTMMPVERLCSLKL